jgi:3' exoribonuclease, RNase T-like
MKSLMTDVETLGTEPGSAIISIGICAFDQDRGVIASEGWAIRAADWHGDIDGKTVQWWSKQNEAARDYSFTGQLTCLQAAMGLKAFMEEWGGDELWANDPDFDVVLLKQWWIRTEAHAKFTLGNFPGGPLRHRLPRSYRTMVAEANRLGISYDHAHSMSSVAHNPVDDACNQARVIIAIRNHLTAAIP